jgi:uncharacterized protein DUF5658
MVAAFLYLQLLDILSTLIGFKFAHAQEMSPFIRLLAPAIGWTSGVIASKVAACGLAALCLYTGRRSLLQKMTYAYAVLVVWNLVVILRTV